MNLLITGATGYAGKFLVERLLEESQYHITCLIRSSSDEEARLRLNERLGSVFAEKYADRLVAVSGNIVDKFLGIAGRQKYKKLAKSIDKVIHVASEVNHMKSLDDLFPSNVLGTANVIRFCKTQRSKDIFFFSSVAAVSNLDENCLEYLSDEKISADLNLLASGYAQSKWSSEYLILRSGLKGSIFRIGEITSPTSDYSKIPDDIIHHFTKVLMKLNLETSYENFSLALLPVDLLADLVIDEIRKPSTGVQLQNLVNKKQKNLEELRGNSLGHRYPNLTNWREHFVSLHHLYYGLSPYRLFASKEAQNERFLFESYLAPLSEQFRSVCEVEYELDWNKWFKCLINSK